MFHHDRPPLPVDQGSPPLPAVEIRFGVVIRVARVRLPRWVLTLLAGLAGAAAGYWRLR
jgi:hypothetical protein